MLLLLLHLLCSIWMILAYFHISHLTLLLGKFTILTNMFGFVDGKKYVGPMPPERKALAVSFPAMTD
jgi:hypothetical protein